MKYPSFIFIVACIFLTTVAVCQAVDDTFEIHQTIISADVTAPSVPTSVVATPISTSQIDIAWTASTDDVGVVGYQLFRDAVFLATTTSASYSDTGLVADTLYGYTVTAFDAVQNISAQSATTSTTTLAIQVPPVSGGETGGGGLIPLELTGLSVEPGLTNAQIEFQANLYTYAVLSWGLTADYEMGSIASDVARKEHALYIESLTPGTVYYFRIELTDTFGRKLVLDHQQFMTDLAPDLTPPTNVTDLQAVGNDRTIVLTWNNPFIDFDSVRIVRSDTFYPQDIWDGRVVYEGDAEQFVDTDVEYGRYYYYALFVKDAFGNYSSGAVAKARLYKEGDLIEPEDLFGNVTELAESQVHPLIRALTLLDLNFFQNGSKLAVAGNTVDIQGDRQLWISLDYDKVPEVLKTITITLRDPEDPSKTFSFLLRVNKDKTAYEAVIAPLGRSGTFEFGVAILDHKNQGLKKMAGAIVSVMPILTAQSGAMVWTKYSVLLGVLILLILLVIHFWRDIVRARSSDSDNQ